MLRVMLWLALSAVAFAPLASADPVEVGSERSETSESCEDETDYSTNETGYVEHYQETCQRTTSSVPLYLDVNEQRVLTVRAVNESETQTSNRNERWDTQQVYYDTYVQSDQSYSGSGNDRVEIETVGGQEAHVIVGDCAWSDAWGESSYADYYSHYGYVGEAEGYRDQSSRCERGVRYGDAEAMATTDCTSRQRWHEDVNFYFNDGDIQHNETTDSECFAGARAGAAGTTIEDSRRVTRCHETYQRHEYYGPDEPAMRVTTCDTGLFVDDETYVVLREHTTEETAPNGSVQPPVTSTFLVLSAGGSEQVVPLP